jgi:hypothetical protein
VILAAPSPVPGRELAPDFRNRYRADALGPVRGDVPWDIELLLPQDALSWPEPVREALQEQVLSEWAPARGQVYGAVHAGLGVWLDYPLVTARVGRRVLVPVVPGNRLPVQGALALPENDRPRRVVLLLDASSSANARTPFLDPDGGVEMVSVLEAERRALEHLVALLSDDWLEFGLIAFGEGTWPIVEPGASVRKVSEGLAQFRREFPEGTGRTDLVCALWLANEWLEDTPRGVGREIYVLTDGDLPHSGRFLDCSQVRRRGGKQAQARCEARRNQMVCPVSKGFRHTRGRSDLVQLDTFGRAVRRKVDVYALVFEPDRAARAYQKLTRVTGGELVRVSSAQAIDVVLPALVGRRIRGVFARNLRTGRETEDMANPQRMSFQGELPLLPGANDVELRVESDRGTAALFRFRVHAAPNHLSSYLEVLRLRNRDLEAKAADLLDEARRQRSLLKRRSLEIQIDSPAAPAAKD